MGILDRALEEVIEVQAASASRIAKSGGSGTRVAAAMTCFEMPTSPGPRVMVSLRKRLS